MGEVKLTYEELATILAQIEVSLNPRSHTPFPKDLEGLEV